MAGYSGFEEAPRRRKFWLLSAVCTFSVGLSVGALVAVAYFKTGQNSGGADLRTVFYNNSYGARPLRNVSEDVQMQRVEIPEDSIVPKVAAVTVSDRFKTVSFVEEPQKSSESSLVKKGIYWGDKVEAALPEGYKAHKHDVWARYVKSAVAVKLESGCGRMQNRLVVFQDGTKGCVRYRQNTDQIQGELFSFYLAQIMKIPNLAPSAVSIVNLNEPLWANLGNDIASAQWNSNKPVVLTQYISNLDTANIPNIFKPVERHLNVLDVENMTQNSVLDEDDTIKALVELAQWSDLIIFDYLTANLDRIVNNLYNYQWNVNIMDAPAHNLAKKSDSDLLIFLDNESGLLHGYRLLKKYEIYHSLLLDNLCIFRQQTAEIIRKLRANRNIGDILRQMFETQNSPVVKDILPTLPDKSVKILNDRIDKVHAQISKCESKFSNLG